MLSESQIRRLLDIGFAACHGGNVVDARAIFKGVLALHPENTAARIGMAMSHIVVNEFEEAEHMLKDELLATHPQDKEAQAMLGLCYALSGRKDEAETCLVPLVDSESSAAAMASEVLQQVRCA